MTGGARVQLRQAGSPRGSQGSHAGVPGGHRPPSHRICLCVQRGAGPGRERSLSGPRAACPRGGLQRPSLPRSQLTAVHLLVFAATSSARRTCRGDASCTGASPDPCARRSPARGFAFQSHTRSSTWGAAERGPGPRDTVWGEITEDAEAPRLEALSYFSAFARLSLSLGRRLTVFAFILVEAELGRIALGRGFAGGNWGLGMYGWTGVGSALLPGAPPRGRWLSSEVSKGAEQGWPLHPAGDKVSSRVRLPSA